MTPDRLQLYRSLAEVELIEGPRGGSVLASIHPAHPGVGALGALDGDPQTVREGERWLRSRGCRQVVAPLEVTTWFPYRAVVQGSDERGDGDRDEPAFSGEPQGNAQTWREAGYGELERYLSTVVACDAAIAQGERRPVAGVTVRTLEDPEDALAAIHALSHRSFTDALLFAPLPRSAFDALYRPLLSRLDPRLVLIAERDGEPVAFTLGLPEALSGKPGRFIVKSVAVVPEVRREGLITWLTGRLHRAAAALGYREGVHALMARSGHAARVFPGRTLREYALFSRGLSS